MKVYEGSGWRKSLHAGVAALLLAVFLGACGGGGSDDPFGNEGPGTSELPGGDSGGEDATDGDPEPGSDDENPGGVSAAVLMRGTAAYDDTARVLNAAFSVLDADSNPIENLDGGDFTILHGSMPDGNYEGHHDAQRLKYPDQLSGRIHLMLDVSNSMAADYAFDAWKTEAARFVTAMDGFGLDVIVYTFSDETTPDPDVPEPTYLGTVSVDGLDNVNAAVKELTPNSVHNTRFYKIVSTKIEQLVNAGWNSVIYQHSPLGDSSPPSSPVAQVELMVIMSDGIDTTGKDSFSLIDNAKDEKFSVVSIASGKNPDVAGLGGISEYLYTVPEQGTYADAVDDAINGIKSYYSSFYVVDYMPPALEKTGDETYEIKLVENTNAGLDITYAPDAFPDPRSVQPYCCKLRIASGAPAGDPVTVGVGENVDFTAVKLWTADQPVFSWTFTSDGNMTIDASKISIAVVNADQQGDAMLSVDAVSEGWSIGPLDLEAR